ncbi:hypothetical protein ACQY0O_007495 [Thecaphora frezii]
MPVAQPTRYDLQPGFVCCLKGDGDGHRPWATGQLVQVALAEGVSPVVKEALEQAQNDWRESIGPGVNTINIQWVGNDKQSDVLIAEGSGLSWSYVGSDAGPKRGSEPTAWLGLGGWKANRGAIWTKDDLLRAARHLWGHIYGLDHPRDESTRWNLEAVGKICGGTQVAAEQLELRRGAPYKGDATDSIMHFDRPAELLANPLAAKLVPQRNATIDAATVQLLRSLYPTYTDVELLMRKASDMYNFGNDAAGKAEVHSKVVTTSRTWNILPGLTKVDMGHGANFRVSCWPTDIKDNQSYRINAGTWADTVLTDAEWKLLSFQQSDGRIRVGRVESNNCRDGGWTTAFASEKFTKYQKFDPPFAQPPRVVVGLAGFDTKTGVGLRVSVYASDITREGCQIHLDSWNDTVAYNIVAVWLAHEADDATIRSGALVHHATGLQAEDTLEQAFESPLACEPRHLWHAFRKIDASPNHDLRIQIEVPERTQKRLTSKVSTWDPESKYYLLEGVYVAII